MRIGSLVVLITLGAIGILIGTVALVERGMEWLFEESVQTDRKIPPGYLSKWLMWLRYVVSADDPAMECKVFMAESTIPKSGMGIFTAIDLRENELVGFPELVIPITFPREVPPLWKVFYNYLWNGDIPGIDVGADQGAFVPGLGSTLNSHHSILTNLYVVGKARYDTAELHRTRDVGSGGFTPYHKCSTHAFRPVTAGSELFSFYGDKFFKSDFRPDASSVREADNLIIDFIEFLVKHQEMSDEVKEAMWNDLIRVFPVSNRLPGYSSIQSLPKRDLRDLFEDESLEKSDSPSREAMQQEHYRPVEWLHKNGFCMDWIEEGPSTVPQAGRGAFATRFIPKGTRIALAPLLHIADPSLYGWNDDQVKKELIRNYSFGHPDAPLMLTPHGAGVNLINHSGKGENVKLRWPSEKLQCHEPEFLELPLSDLRHESVPRLSLEYVVTRSIYPGEELFLNYGRRWEEAWDLHVHRWLPQTQWFLHPSQMSVDAPFRTAEEVKHDPYPPNLYPICQPSYVQDVDGHNVYITPKERVKWVPCEIRSRLNNVYQIELDSDHTVVYQVPHSAIKLETYPGLSDWALPGAFRHELDLPDELVPSVWRTRPKAFSAGEEPTVEDIAKVL